MPAREAARAKVNLYLHVVGRRADGYHLLDSLVVFAGAADQVEAEPHSALTLELRGPAAAGLAGDGADNLVLRAARLLAEAGNTTAGARLRLHKTLPVASGIGGGSADAAATLRLLSRLWRLALPPAALAALALRLGADVPVCLAGTPTRMSGIGEVLAPAPPLPPFGLLLVNPGVAVATPDVFRARAGPFSPPAELGTGWGEATGLAAALARQRNDLEAAAIALCPAIADARAAIAGAPGCLLARMSGSGATCFGLFASAAAAEAAATAIGAPAHWWVWGGAGHTGPLARTAEPD